MASEYYSSSDFSRKRRSSQFETTPSKREYTDKVRGIKFLVPEYTAGAIIGKAGKNIAEQRERFGTYVKMSPGKVYFPNTEDRVCLILGEQGEQDDGRTVACFHHLNQLTREDSEQFEKKRRPRDPDRINQIKLLLTNNTAGLIIGKGGETIKSIQEQTSTRIMITPFDPDLDERVCCISADDYENTLKATDYVLDKVIKDPEGYVSKNLMYNGPADVYSRQSYGGGGGGGGGRHGYPDYDRRGGYDRGYTSSRHSERHADYSHSTTGGYVDAGVSGNLYVLDERDPTSLVLGIMEKFVGAIVGKNGSTISEIQSISHKEEYVPGTRDRKITIKGEPQAVESAYALINDKVSEFTDRRRN